MENGESFAGACQAGHPPVRHCGDVRLRALVKGNWLGSSVSLWAKPHPWRRATARRFFWLTGQKRVFRRGTKGSNPSSSTSEFSANQAFSHQWRSSHLRRFPARRIAELALELATAQRHPRRRLNRPLHRALTLYPGQQPVLIALQPLSKARIHRRVPKRAGACMTILSVKNCHAFLSVRNIY